jgi:hypothetical protein
MSAPWNIKIGDLVVCISDELPFAACARQRAAAGRIERGKIYRVAKVFPTSRGRGLHLVGVEHRPTDGWQAARFRKLQAADGEFISLIKEMAPTGALSNE